MTKETCSSSGNSVRISCPRRYSVPRTSSMRLKLSKKSRAVTRPATRKHVNSDRLPSVSKRMPPSKLSTSLRGDFSFFFGVCWDGLALEAGTSKRSTAMLAGKNLGEKRPIPIFLRISVYSCLHQERDAVGRIQRFLAIHGFGWNLPRAHG